MRQIVVRTKGFPRRIVHRVVSYPQLAGQWDPAVRFLIRISYESELLALEKLIAAGVENLAILTRVERIYGESKFPSVLETGEPLQAGDVVAISDQMRRVHVLLRESDSHHTVFLTNRCNSNCLMCSQPPTFQDDSWLVEEAIAVAAHLHKSPRLLGFTGGEPLLLGSQLREIFDVFARHHPSTDFDVLTNGRLLSDSRLGKELFEGLLHRITWMVPLYGHADFLHDFIVQSVGAFDQTINGLLTLQQYRQPVQLRIVLIEPTLRILPQLCEFIGRNLPFVREVALMGCEPVGFALANRKLCEVDLKAWSHQIEGGVRWLRRMRLRPIVMNVPLCALPRSIRPYSCQSISDWKRVFAEECENCVGKDGCAGLFAWHERGWRPSIIRPLEEAR